MCFGGRGWLPARLASVIGGRGWPGGRQHGYGMSDPLRQMPPPTAKTCIFLGKLTTSRQLIWLAEGGVGCKNTLYFRALLAVRQLATLADWG
jgi:hypothetical protein